jgi:hypothetical protein
MRKKTHLWNNLQHIESGQYLVEEIWFNVLLFCFLITLIFVSAMKSVAQLASVWNKPVFGWVSNDIEFRNKTIYSTLIRLLGPLNRFRKN